MAVVDTYIQGTAKSTGNLAPSVAGTVAGKAQGPALGLGYGFGKTGVAPYAPQLTSPGNGASSDLTDTTFEWTYASPYGVAQQGYAIRFSLSSQPGVWSWFNGTVLVSSEVLIESAVTQVTIPSGLLLNGNSYSWEVRVQDTNGILSPYSQPSLVVGAATPTVTITGPSGTQTVGSVTLTWLNQNVTTVATWQVILYTQAQTQASGFVAGSSPWVWNSGLTLGSATSVVLPNVPVGTFVAYVQISSITGALSAWTPWTITYSYTAPAQPTLSATYNQSSQTVTLTLTGADTGSLLGNTTGSVYRSLDGGSTWTVVSTFDAVPLPATGEDATETDYTPLATQDNGSSYSPVYYYGVVTGPNGITSPRSATQEVQPSFPASTSGVPSNGWNFAYGTNYKSSVQPMVTKFEQTQKIRGGLHQVLGNPEPVYLYDVTNSRTLKLTIRTLAETDWVAVKTLVGLDPPTIIYLTNIYGLVGFFQIDPSGYSTEQQPGATKATIRDTTVTLVETFRLPTEGAGT